jgi:PAS domain S-box-containing protein
MSSRLTLIPTLSERPLRRPNLALGSLGLVLMTLALIWLGFGLFIWSDRSASHADVTRDTTNLSRGFAEHVNRTIEGVEQVMLLLRAAYAADPAQINLARWAAPRAFRNELTLQISIVGPDGMLLDSNLGRPATPVDLSDRAHFRAQLDPSRDDLYISVPVLGRVSNHTTIQLSRKLFDAAGHFAGVLVVSIDTGTLAAFYQSIQIDNGEILLVGTDGVVRARGPVTAAGIGQQIRTTALAPILNAGGSGEIAAASVVDGVPRIYAYRRLENYPLLVAVGLARSDIEGPLIRHMVTAFVTALGLSVLVLLVGAALLRREARLQRTQHALAARNEALRRSAARLHDSERQLRRFIEAAPVALAMFDLEHRIIAVSEIYRKLKLNGRDLDSVLGQSIDQISPPIDPRWADRRRRCLGGELLSSVGEAFTDADGKPSWHRWELRPWFAVDGTIGGIVYFTEDITARVETEAALRQSQKLEALGRLTGGIAHDFNNLLAVVMLNADMLAEELTEEPSLESLARGIVTSARNGANLTQRLLAYARRQTLQPKVIDLGAFLQEQLVMMRRSLGPAISIAPEVDPDLAMVEADPSQIGDALLNLAINARDAMQGGGRITIAARNRVLTDMDITGLQDAHTGPHVELSVADTGVGMEPEVLAHAADPFFTTKGVGEGSGLGLSMVDGFVRQSGGHMVITSARGEGTCVSLFLPQAKSIPKPLRTIQSPVPRGEGRERVLVVDDNDEVREAVSRMLSSLGYRVSEAASGPQALEELERDGPADLLLADIVMPDGMSGLQLAEKTQERWPQMRVLFASGFLPTDMEGGQTPPPQRLLRKPFNRHVLAESVRDVLSAPVVIP